MKIAARFPIKQSPLLLVAILLVHGLIVLYGFFSFNHFWQITLLSLSVLLSSFYCFRRYQRLTESQSDLCWSGESWLISLSLPNTKSLLASKSLERHITIYLTLKKESWVTRNMCLLHFSDGEKNYCWLFSRFQLGHKLYSQLTYLVKLN